MVKVRHDHASDFFADAVRQSDDAQLFDERRRVISFFNLVWINVLAVCVNDNLFRASDEIEVAFFVEPSEVACVQPTINERCARG